MAWIDEHPESDEWKKGLEKHGFEQEEYELRAAGNVKFKSPFPKTSEPFYRRKIIYETYQASIEETYFWILNQVTFDCGLPEVHKIKDYFTSSESSALFGINMQRIAQQQEKTAQYLGTIANMIKSLFQLVRELRILDERIRLYQDSDYKKEKPDQAAEISLKGYWIDLVEGGAKNPASVYGLARDVGFTTLPDLFFDAPPMTSDKVDKYVDKLEFNRKVKEVLKRKLKVYLIWKEHTYKELVNRKTFTIKYLNQHHKVIRMYSQWILPYLKNIRRMTHKDFSSSANLIAAFENTIIEIEFLAARPGKTTHQPCILCYFFYRTTPSMAFQQEGFQRGPLHIGRIEIEMRAYGWTKREIENYVKYRKEEEDDILMTINESVKAAYDALGEDLKKYIEEAEKAGKKEEAPLPTKAELVSAAMPFTSIFTGFADLFGAFIQKRCMKCGALSKVTDTKCSKCGTQFIVKKKKSDQFKLIQEKSLAESEANKQLWVVYDKYKKSHKMLAW